MLIGLVIVGCKQKEEASEKPLTPAQPGAAAVSTVAQKGVVQEVLQATEYTYLNVKSGETTLWLAVTKREIEVGQTIGFNLGSGLEQKNFASKDLDRTFETVYLMNSISTGDSTPMGMPSSMSPHGTMAGSTKPMVGKQEVAVDPVDGGISIGQLYGNTATYGGQSVKIRGKVTKVNSGIMGRNWVHIQDGTEADGQFDLTVTTQDAAKVGDVVVVQGKITLDKDFGSGYKYDVLMEEASCQVE